jgi:signal transduction histidine kinase/CheY-like chemotaxis protein
MARLRLRTIFVLLVLVTTVPLAGLASWVTYRSWRQQQSLIDRQNVEQARAVGEAIDEEVGRTIAALNVLTLLEPIDDADKTHFAQIASRMLPLHSGWQSIRLIGPSLQVLATTDSSPEPHVVANPDWVRAIFGSGHPAVSDARQDPATGRWVVNIGVPVLRGGTVRHVLSARVFTQVFGEILARQTAPAGGVLTVIDATPKIIARTRNEERYLGTPPSPDFIVHSRGSTTGTWRARMLEGTPSYSAWSRSDLTGWTIGLALPADAVDGPVRRSFGTLIAAAVITLTTGFVIALLMTRNIVRTQTAAAAAARALARGEPVVPFSSTIAEADALSSGLRDAALILEKRLRERDQAQREADESRMKLLEREQTARRAAESLNRAKDEFVATVSHELRTPLNAIVGWVALLRSATLTPAQQKHALDVIDRNSRAQTQLVEDLLDMSRVIQGQVQLDLRPLDLATVMAAAIESVKPTAAARQIVLTTRFERGRAFVSGDHRRLQQVFWNLLSNSLKFTPPRGSVDVGIEAVGGEAVVTITDSGEGIAPEFLPHVFDRFSQEVSSVTRTHAGLGIGLSLVRHLTELHGGRVAVTSDGKACGATFTIRLPLLPEHELRELGIVAHAAGSPSTGRSLEGLRVLLVDDDADTTDLVGAALTQAGAAVTCAGSVVEALGALGTTPIDLVVSDIAMPGGSGYDLIAAIRTSPSTARLTVVAITAYGRPEDRERILAAGFDAHLAKPLDPRALVGLLAELAELAQS